MAFVQAPTVVHWQPLPVHGIEGVPQSVNGAFEDAGIGQVKLVSFSFQQAPCRLGLLDAGRREVDVGPASEAIF